MNFEELPESAEEPRERTMDKMGEQLNRSVEDSSWSVALVKRAAERAKRGGKVVNELLIHYTSLGLKIGDFPWYECTLRP